MIRHAFWVGVTVAAIVFVQMVGVTTRGPLTNCVELPDHPGAVVCGGRRVARAASADAPEAATVETILAGPLSTAVLTADHAAPLPSWLPAGVLSWEAEIRTASEDVGLDPLALAILMSIECPSGNENCGSFAGAVGLTQFMPGTAASVEGRSGINCSDRTDGQTSLRCGAYHFVELLQSCGSLWYNGREGNALACAGTGYSAGAGYIPAFKAHVAAGGDPRYAPIPAETRLWVTKALDMWTRAGRR